MTCRCWGRWCIVWLLTCHGRNYGTALARQKTHIMERICGRVTAVLRNRGLRTSPGDSLLEHGPRVQARIQGPQIRGLEVWAP